MNNKAVDCSFHFEDDTHFKILKFLDYKSLFACSRVDKNWNVKSHNARSKWYFDLNELECTGLSSHIENIHSEFRLAENVSIFLRQDPTFAHIVPDLSKFKKIKQLILKVCVF